MCQKEMLKKMQIYTYIEDRVVCLSKGEIIGGTVYSPSIH